MLSFKYIDNVCRLQNIPQEGCNIVTLAKRYMQQNKYETSMKIGYFVEHDQVSCRIHWDKYAQIDFLIVNVIFNRPKTFVESYSFFHNYMKHVETSLKNLKTIANPTYKKVYYRLTLKLTSGDGEMWLDSSNLKMIDHDRFHNFVYKISKRYENLFLEYVLHWSSNEDGNRKMIIVDQLTDLTMETSSLPVQLFNETLAASKIIPRIKDLPEYMNVYSNSIVLFHKSLDNFFNIVSAAGFTSVYFKPGMNTFKIFI